MTPKSEFTPLLSIGFHTCSLEELREMCVNNFPYSHTRNDIMIGLEKVIEMMESVGLIGEVWINGSFLTKKNDPNDSDVVIFVPIEEYESNKKDIIDVIEYIGSNLREHFLCHSHVVPQYPKEDFRFIEFDWMRSYWIKQFGFSRNQEIKGIAVYNTKVKK